MVDSELPRQAMLLAAGSGIRLRPLTYNVPKCMVPIDGKPLLEHNIEHLRRFGVLDLVINVSHLAEVVTDYFGDGSRWGVNITYSFETQPLGTAGGVKNVASFFDSTFFVWYGDNMSTCDLRRLYEFHRRHEGVATIALFHRDDPTTSGIVAVDSNDRIERFLEKPEPCQVFSHWVSAGLFVLERYVLGAIPSGFSDFGRDVFPSLLASSAPLFGYRMNESEGLWWIDTPADLAKLRAPGSNRSRKSA